MLEGVVSRNIIFPEIKSKTLKFGSKDYVHQWQFRQKEMMLLLNRRGYLPINSNNSERNSDNLKLAFLLGFQLGILFLDIQAERKNIFTLHLTTHIEERALHTDANV